MIALTLISSAALVTFHDQSVRYQKRIDTTIKQLEDQRAKQRTELEQKMHDLQIQNDAKQKTIDDLNTQLQAKAEAKQNVLARATSAAVSFVAPVAYASDGNSAKAFIYSHESGNNPGAINVSSGACGLGQALPCAKMPCSLSDYACQDNFFTNYMLSRYGSWANAAAFWRAHSWW